MREFVIRRLRRAPIIEPLWDEYERMQAMLQTALAERDTAQATREAALAERDAAQAAREAALAERDAAQAAREAALAELDAAQAAQEATLCLYRQALCSTSLPLQTDSVTVLRQILERTRPRITVAITNDDPNEVTRVSNLLHTARLHGLLIIIYGQGPAPEQVEIDTLKRIEIIHPGIDQSQRLESLVHNGPVEPLFVALNAGPYAPELIVLPDLDKFQIAVAAYSKILSRQGSELPAFMVMTDDLDFELLALREPVGFEKIISNLTAEVFANLIYFSDKRSTGCWALYGIMAATCNYDDAVFSIEGYSLVKRPHKAHYFALSLLTRERRDFEQSLRLCSYNTTTRLKETSNLWHMAAGEAGLMWT